MAKRKPATKAPAGLDPQKTATIGIVTIRTPNSAPPAFEAHFWHARIEDGAVAMFFDQWHGDRPGRRVEARMPFFMVPHLMKTFDSGFGVDIAQYVTEHPVTAPKPAPRPTDAAFPAHDVIRVQAMRFLRSQNDAEVYLYALSPIQAFDRAHESLAKGRAPEPVPVVAILRIGGTVGAMAAMVVGLVAVARELAEMEQHEAAVTEGQGK